MLSRTLVVLVVASCSSPKHANTAPGSSSVGGAPPALLVPAAVTLEHLENGDRACYVGIKRPDGTEASLEGDFELCKGGALDATALIGKPVTYTTKHAKVLAASCQGDMDCGKSDEVDLIVTITAAP